MFVSCINIWQVPKKFFEHEDPTDAMKNTDWSFYLAST